jgi:hypothetical protein
LLLKATTCRFDGLISNRKAPRSSKREGGKGYIAPPIENSTEGKRRANFVITGERLVFELPLRTKSEANCFEHWTKKHKRHQGQRLAISQAIFPVRGQIPLPCKILLTRLAPKTLDKHDNLPMSFKYIVDAICSIITGNYKPGKADGDERISINYDQIISKEYGIIIEITF